MGLEELPVDTTIMGARPPGIVQFGIEGKWSIHSGALQRIGILPLNNLKIYNDIQFAFLCLNNHELAQYP